MATAIMEAQLRAALDTDIELAKRACRTRFLQPSGVGVEFRATEVGDWQWKNGQYELVVDGQGPIVRVDTVAEAVRYTRETLSHWTGS
jgi:hypothetical protein